MLIDTHTHLHFAQFDADRSEVLERARAEGLKKMINVAVDRDSWAKGLELCGQFEELYATLGFHPYHADELTEETLVEWSELIEKNPKIVAIGECGLDYAKAQVERSVQKVAFRRQLLFAIDKNLPVVIHNREADHDCLEILDEVSLEHDDKLKVVFHCFASDLGFAREVWQRGFHTSFTAIITYPKSGELRKVVKECPLDRFMLETDCPFLPPQSKRGERSEPAFVSEVAQKVAEIKEMDFEEVCDISTRNAERFFAL